MSAFKMLARQVDYIKVNGVPGKFVLHEAEC